MICFIALFVFGILAIFSATYRPIAKEAFDCVFRRITFRKCETGLNTKLKSQITGSFMRISPGFSRFVYRYFEVISWFFTILLIASLVYSAIGMYNYAIYGNCSGPQGGFCIFDPVGSLEAQQCSAIEAKPDGKIIKPLIYANDPSLGNPNAQVTLIEIGCFQCPYTKKEQPIIKQLLSQYNGSIYYVYRDLPLEKLHPGAERTAEAALCANDQGKYFEYTDLLFGNQDKTDAQSLKGFAVQLGLNAAQFNQCIDNRTYQTKVWQDTQDMQRGGIYGTPTFFVNNISMVGPRTEREFTKLIDRELGKKTFWDYVFFWVKK
jgi:protein-disulfide isomerase